MKVTLELTFNEEVDPQSVADAVYQALEHNDVLEGVMIKDDKP